MPGSNASLGDRALLREPDLIEVFNKDPKFRYRFAHEDSRNIMIKQLVGYEICTGQSGEKLGATGEAVSKTGTALKVGDAILMRVPVEKYEERKLLRQARVKSRTAAPLASFSDEVRRRGQGAVLPISGRQVAAEADRERKGE